MKPLGFHHVAIQARDVAHVAAFYLEKLGLPELARYHRDDGSLRSVWVGVGSAATDGFFAIEALDETQRGGALGYSMVALRIAPQEKTALEATLASHHVAIERRTGFTLYVRDPEGNLVGFSHHPFASP
jgi:catechol 2,3-dioxygenase-like lactoylglutathione lyase family enzyme